MFPFIDMLKLLPWRLIGAAALALAVFVGGYLDGEQHVTARWDAEKAPRSSARAPPRRSPFRPSARSSRRCRRN